MAVAEREAVPPEATVAGEAGLMLTEKVWTTGLTVSVVVLVSLKTSDPLEVPVADRVTVWSLSVVLASAV